MSNIKLSKSEENYLKSIFNLSEFGNKQVTTNSISKILNIEPASVTDMIKKLSKKISFTMRNIKEVLYQNQE